MHELSRAKAILHAAAQLATSQRAGAAEEIVAVNVALNPLAGADGEELRECFALAARGTPFAGVELRLTEMRLQGKCAACGRPVEIAGPETRCPCGQDDLRLPVEDDWKLTGLERRGGQEEP